MALIGYHASHEQFAPSRLVHCVQDAEKAGFGVFFFPTTFSRKKAKKTTFSGDVSSLFLSFLFLFVAQLHFLYTLYGKIGIWLREFFSQMPLPKPNGISVRH